MINLTKMTANVNNIQALSDLPNQTDGLTPDGLKARYDKAGSDIKTFLNTSLIPEIEQLLNALYPIGRGFIDFTDTDYSNYLGFTWERELLGVTPVGVNPSDSDFNEVGKTGGEKTHQLTLSEIPKHNHTTKLRNQSNTEDLTLTISGAGKKYGTGVSGILSQTSGWGSYGNAGWLNISNEEKGGDLAHNNLQPYQVVSYWKRVS